MDQSVAAAASDTNMKLLDVKARLLLTGGILVLSEMQTAIHL